MVFTTFDGGVLSDAQNVVGKDAGEDNGGGP